MNGSAASDSRRGQRLIADRITAEPRFADRVARELDAELSKHDIDDIAEILIWDDPESAVLAHVIGLARGVRVLRATEVQGLVEAVDGPSQGARVLLLAPAFRTDGAWRALATIVETAGAAVAAVATIEQTAALNAVIEDGKSVVVLPRSDDLTSPGDLA